MVSSKEYGDFASKLLDSVETVDQAKDVILRGTWTTEYLADRLMQLTGEGTYTVLGPALDYAEKRFKEYKNG